MDEKKPATQDVSPAPARTSAPLCPGLEQPGGTERANAALEIRNSADYRCYQLLSMVLEQCGGVALAKAFYDEDQAGDWILEAREAIEERKAANDEFLKAVAGH